MNENIKWFAAAAAVVGLSIGAVIFRDKWWSDTAAAPDTPAVAVPAPPPAPEEPAIKHPLPEAAGDEALPPLDGSDAVVLSALEGLMGQKSAEQLIVPKDLVRHIVVTVDNLSTGKVAERLRPAKPAPGKFAVAGTEEAPVLDPANYERYSAFIQTLQSMDTALLVSTYTRYYPLFQEAYENLGHPPQYFNDRVIEVIDHLLETPDIEGPIPLAQPNVQYEFADPKLESRSAGQKALIRMGSANGAVVKTKLRELRAALAAQKPAP
jgi:hypothetical protein